MGLLEILGRPENSKAAGIPMKIRGRANGPDFTVAEEPPQRNRPHFLTEKVTIMIGITVEVLTSSQARKKQCPLGNAGVMFH